jgi:hypothetical protein
MFVNGKWLAKPPTYPCIQNGEKDGIPIKMNLFEFRNMEKSNEYGQIYTLDEFCKVFNKM